MTAKPENLIYGVDDRPPLATLLGQGLQQVIANSSGWIIMAAVVTTIGATTGELTQMLRMGMIAVGIGAMLQSLTRGPVGSGFFCPPVCGPAYASASVLAGTGFGLPVLFGMTLMAGVFEVILARLLPRLRALFPPEVIGVVMTMVGIAMLPLSIPRLYGLSPGGPSATTWTVVEGSGLGIGLLTFAVMAGCTVWGRAQLKLYPALVGSGLGWAGCYTLGLIPKSTLQAIAEAPWFGWPGLPSQGFAFESSLLVPFLVAGMAASLKGVGDLTLCQKVNDADWKRTDLQSVSNGATASGLTTTMCGLLGTLGHSTSSSNVGLSVAAGATSRTIGFSMGALMILIAFLPKISAVIASLPAPLMGATLLYAACFMILAGVQMLASRLLDARRILMAGVAISLGLSVSMMPELYREAPEIIKPIVASSVSFSAALAVLLNVVFLLGSKKSVEFELPPGEDHYTRIRDTLMRFGSSVAARKEVIGASIDALGLACEALGDGFTQGPVRVVVTFDEFSLDMDLFYKGQALDVPDERPGRSDLLNDPNGVAKMSAWLMAQKAQRVTTSERQGVHHIALRLTQ